MSATTQQPVQWRLDFQVELLEDASCGSGLGRLGMVDSTVARDHRGKPVIWWSTWRGLMREAGEQWLLARADAGDNPSNLNQDRKLLYYLLGHPVNKASQNASRERGALIVSSLRPNARQTQEEKEATTWSTTWSFTARELHSRSPMEKTLRTVESVKAGTRFSGYVILADPASGGPWQKGSVNLADVQRVVLACLKRISAVGGRRQRGTGAIRLQFPHGEEFRPVQAGQNNVENLVSEDTSGPVVLAFELKNLEPLFFANAVVVGNIGETLAYIPGSSLRGGLLHFIRSQDPTLAEKLAQPQQMWVSDGLVVPPPASGIPLTDRQVVPIPLSLREPKSKGRPSNWPAGAPDELLGASREQDQVARNIEAGSKNGRFPAAEKTKRIKRPDVLATKIGDSWWVRGTAQTQVHLRNRVPTGRIDPGRRGELKPNPSTGEKSYVDQETPGCQEDALFSQKMLVPDQVFQAHIGFASAKYARRFLQLLAPLVASKGHASWCLRLGRGGQPVVVRNVAVLRLPQGQVSQNHPGFLTVTLASELICRTPRLTYSTCPGPELWYSMLEHVQTVHPWLNLDLEKIDPHQIKLSPDLSVVESVPVLGFNSASGLPRAMAVAVRRGSVFVFQGERGSLESFAHALNLVAANGLGLGERTAEGFGRFTVNLNLHQPSWWEKLPQVVSQAHLPRSSPKPPPQLDEENVLERVFEHKKKVGALNANQWQFLRHQAELCRNQEELDALYDKLLEHSRRISGSPWQSVLQDLQKATRQLHSFREKQLFLMALAALKVKENQSG